MTVLLLQEPHKILEPCCLSSKNQLKRKRKKKKKYLKETLLAYVSLISLLYRSKYSTWTETLASPHNKAIISLWSVLASVVDCYYSSLFRYRPFKVNPWTVQWSKQGIGCGVGGNSTTPGLHFSSILRSPPSLPPLPTMSRGRSKPLPRTRLASWGAAYGLQDPTHVASAGENSDQPKP